MTVKVVPTEALDAALRRAIIDVCIAAHDNEDFNNLFSYIPSGGRHFLTYEGDDLVAHAVVTTRWAQPEPHAPLRTAYVDAVSTRPDMQGQGFGSRTMQALADSIDDYEIAGLETDKPGFYARLGWELWRGPLAGRSTEGLVPTPTATGVMILRLARTPELALDRAMTIECQTARIW